MIEVVNLLSILALKSIKFNRIYSYRAFKNFHIFIRNLYFCELNFQDLFLVLMKNKGALGDKKFSRL